MRIYAILVTTFGVVLTGCVGAAAPLTTQDIGFLRGCWVQKEAPGEAIQGFLRLLPRSSEDDAALWGDVIDARDGAWRPTHRLAFGADGAYMTIGRDPLPVETGSRALNRIADPPRNAGLRPVAYRATWRLPPINASEGWVLADGTHETLRIYLLKADATEGEVIFDGERDGCD